MVSVCVCVCVGGGGNFCEIFNLPNLPKDCQILIPTHISIYCAHE